MKIKSSEIFNQIVEKFRSDDRLLTINDTLEMKHKVGCSHVVLHVQNNGTIVINERIDGSKWVPARKYHSSQTQVAAGAFKEFVDILYPLNGLHKD